MTAEFRLSTGRTCRLGNPLIPLLPDYHVLYFPQEQGAPTEEEVDEFLVMSRRVARQLGGACFGDPECYTILYNGARTRRTPGIHVHILPARSVRAKRFALLCLVAKRALRWFRPPWRAAAQLRARRAEA
jgi:diadenosine tetraphosphate (Ap4A) HIT family hydrolase